MHGKGFKMMELYIETLTGAAFELRVSPYETVQDVKARIQNLEGIPVSQQHLIWQSLELEDDYSLQDYSIHDGATLKLVLTMRGGPINTRRIPVDDPTLRDMAEYYLSEANREDIMEKLPQGNRPMTVIVYHNGDQLNFYRVVDPESTSPLSESISGASMYNLYDEEEEEEEVGEEVAEKCEENDKTREKMKLLKVKMDSLSLNKKPKKKLVPRPPSSGRPSSKSRVRSFPPTSGKRSGHLNRKSCLPPVGGYTNVQAAALTDGEVIEHKGNITHSSVTTANGDSGCEYSTKASTESRPSGENKELLQNSANYKARSQLVSSLRQDLSRTRETPTSAAVAGERGTPVEPINSNIPSSGNANVADRLETLLRRAHQSSADGVSTSASPARKWEFSHELLLKGDGGGNPSSAGRKKDSSLESLKGSLAVHPAGGSRVPVPVPPASRGALERVLEDSSCGSAGPGRPSTTSSRSKDLSLEAFKESLGTHHRPTAPTKPSSSGKKSERKSNASTGVILESLDPSEVRAMSGMLSSIVRSASKQRGSGFTLSGGGLTEIARIPTPEGRHMSARLQRLSASRDGPISPHPRLPPVKPVKKKTSKRCYVCAKKTGLATSYSCRCGNNFCATHRYAEAHDCSYDYKTEGRKILEQSNPVVTAPKLPKI